MLQFIVSQRVRCDLGTEQQQQFTVVLEILARATRPKKERKKEGIHIGREEVKLSFLTGDILFVEPPPRPSP